MKPAYSEDTPSVLAILVKAGRRPLAYCLLVVAGGMAYLGVGDEADTRCLEGSEEDVGKELGNSCSSKIDGCAVLQVSALPLVCMRCDSP